MSRPARTSIFGPSAAEPLEEERSPHPLLYGLLAVIALAAVVAWMRYDPVTAGSGMVCPEGSVSEPLDFADFDDDRQVCTVANSTSTTVVFGAAARNDGWLPVTVSEVRLGEVAGGLFTVDEIRMDVDGADAPFEGFTLRPGEERTLWVSGFMPSCHEAPRQRSLTFHHLPLRTRVFGLPRDSEVPFTRPIRLVVERC